jgi:hypothetical protein
VILFLKDKNIVMETQNQLQFSNPDPRNDFALFHLIDESFQHAENYFSNYRNYYGKFMNIHAFQTFRASMERMNNEGQQCLLDVTSRNGNVVGLVGMNNISHSFVANNQNNFIIS